MLQKAILCTFFVFLLIFSFISTSESASTTAQLTTPEVWTAGTRLLIPDRVMENYEKESDSWSHPYVYLFAKYFSTGPSLKDKRKETVYIPLVKEQAGEGEQKEVMMDIMNVRRSKDNGNVFITLQEVNPKNILVQGSSISEREQNTDSTTKAAANCIMCAQAGEPVNNQGQTTIYFVNVMNQLIQNFQNRITDINLELRNTVENFCRTCGGVDIADFMDYVDKVAKKQKIPTDLLLSIMYKESSGDCNAKNEVKDKNKNKKSDEVGLFQLNMKDSTELKECKNDTSSKKVTPEEMKSACFGSPYREGTPCNPIYNLNPKETKVCLNNPYCNLEEAVNQINCKWLTEHAGKCVEGTSEYEEVCKNTYDNNSPRMPDKSWKQMSHQEKNFWRSVLLAYQRGHDITFPPREEIDSKIGKTDIDDIWTLSLLYYGQLLEDMKKKEENLKGNNSVPEDFHPTESESKQIDQYKKCTNFNECKSIINSLSYVHTILDFEYKKEEDQPSIIDSWKKYREDNSLKCPEEKKTSPE